MSEQQSPPSMILDQGQGLATDFERIRGELAGSLRKIWDEDAEKREIKAGITWDLTLLCVWVWSFNIVGIMFFPQPPNDFRIYCVIVLGMFGYAAAIWFRKRQIIRRHREGRACVDQICRDMYDDSLV